MPANPKILTGKSDWETPWEIFNHWNDRFHFSLDVCANEKNAKVENYLNEVDDGLYCSWWDNGGVCWLNPPYNRQIKKWVERAYKESLNGCLICALLPVDPSTRWWQEYVTKADYIYYYPKRIKFVGATGSPNFASAIVIWGLNPK